MKMLFLLLGFVIGVVAAIIFVSQFKDGVLKIDTSDPDKDLYLFEVDDLDNLSHRKQIILKVEVEDFSDSRE